jgi:predicted nucleic acid-binding protein
VSGEAADRGLIDTNILIRLAMVDPDELPGELVICAITLAELSAGPHLADEPAERARRISVLQHAEATFEPLPFDAEAARAFGVVSATVGRKPRRRIADLMIASVAIVNGLPVYTTNPDDFAGLDDLMAVVPVRRTGD